MTHIASLFLKLNRLSFLLIVFFLINVCLLGKTQAENSKQTQNLEQVQKLKQAQSKEAYNPTANVTPSIYVTAYPDHIVAIEGNFLIWKDGSKMPIKNLVKLETFKEALDNPDLYRQLIIPYTPGPLKNPPTEDSDPGRIRYVPFFQKMYGGTQEEVRKNLVEVEWLPRTFKGVSAVKLLVTQVNDVSDKIKKISAELDDLVQKKPHYKKYLKNPGGTFSWRLIAGTDRPSSHSFGMTIDINVAHSHYWLWDYKKAHGLSLETELKESSISDKNVPAYKNDIPWDIVAIFEKHHFIWGGKWFHYDTMHFEYRPELYRKDTN